jgi:molecular chaperone GrpE
MTDPIEIDEETLLSRFRQWLHEARAEVDADTDAFSPTSSPVESATEPEDHDVGLYRLVEEFTALRHELKLQTKSTRGLQDQTEALVPALRQAIEQFRAVEPREAQAAWTAGKPLAEALADLDEALDRGRAEIEKARDRLVEAPSRELSAALDAHFARQGWFRRRRVRSYHEQVRAIIQQHGPESRRPFFDALLEGYGLIQARLRRAMDAEQLHRIDCLGQPVDPDLMTVLEVVDDPDRPTGEVVEEVRRGYTWRGRVLRYAEVRASRSPTPAENEVVELDQNVNGEIEPDREDGGEPEPGQELTERE